MHLTSESFSGDTPPAVRWQRARFCRSLGTILFLLLSMMAFSLPVSANNTTNEPLDGRRPLVAQAPPAAPAPAPIAAPAAIPAPAPPEGILSLKDGRKLEGRLASVTARDVGWTLPTGQTITFPLTLVEKLEVKPIANGTAGEEEKTASADAKETSEEESAMSPPEAFFPEGDGEGLIEPVDQTVIDEEVKAVETADASVDGESVENADGEASSDEEGLYELTQFEESVVSPFPEPLTFPYRFSRKQLADWTKRFEIGARMLSGNSEETALNSEARFENRCWDYTTRIDAGGKWGEARGIQTSNQLFANANVDIGEVGSWIFYVTNQNQYDELQDLDYRGTLSAGIGHRFFDDEDRRLITRIGPGVTAEEYHSPGNDRVTADIFAEAEFQWPLFDRTRFESKSTIRPSIEDYEVFRFTNDMAVLVQLDEQSSWQFKLGVKQEYNSHPAINRKKSDFTTVFQLVYTLK